MELSSKKVLHSKRTAMENGEEAEQIGGGKDLMSALRMFTFHRITVSTC